MQKVRPIFFSCLLVSVFLLANAFAQPAIQMEITAIDMGKVESGVGFLEFVYPFTSTGDEPLIFMDQAPELRFHSDTYPKKPIPPGGKGEIILRMPGSHPGTFKRAYQFQTNAGIVEVVMKATLLPAAPKAKKPSAEIFQHVKANFYRDANGTLFLKSMLPPSNGEAKPKETFQPAPAIDLDSWRKLSSGSQGFSRDNQNVYYHSTDEEGEKMKVIPDADPESFLVFGHLWAKDSTTVFYMDEVVRDLDPDKMEIVKGQAPEFFHYVKDGEGVFFHYHPIPGALPGSFEVLPVEQGTQPLARDKKAVYQEWRKIEDR